MEGTKVNLGQYRSLENRWRKAIERGKTVQVIVELDYSSDRRRPDIIDVAYTIDGRTRWVTIANTPKRGDAET